MGYKSDIEIAQSVTMKPITEIAKVAGIADEYLEQYGKYKAKIDMSLMDKNTKKGKLILVTAITPPLQARARPQPPSAWLTV